MVVLANISGMMVQKSDRRQTGLVSHKDRDCSGYQTPFPSLQYTAGLYFPSSSAGKWDHIIGWDVGKSNVHHSQAHSLKPSQIVFLPLSLFLSEAGGQKFASLVDVKANKRRSLILESAVREQLPSKWPGWEFSYRKVA